MPPCRCRAELCPQPQGVEVVSLDLVGATGEVVEVLVDAEEAAGEDIGAAGGQRYAEAGGVIGGEPLALAGLPLARQPSASGG